MAPDDPPLPDSVEAWPCSKCEDPHDYHALFWCPRAENWTCRGCHCLGHLPITTEVCSRVLGRVCAPEDPVTEIEIPRSLAEVYDSGSGHPVHFRCATSRRTGSRADGRRGSGKPGPVNCSLLPAAARWLAADRARNAIASVPGWWSVAVLDLDTDDAGSAACQPGRRVRGTSGRPGRSSPRPAACT